MDLAAVAARGAAVLAEARGALLVGTPSHEVHGWVPSGFSLMNGTINLRQSRVLSLIHASHRHVAHAGFTFMCGWICSKIAVCAWVALLALHVILQQSDIWSGGCIGVWIALRGFRAGGSSWRASQLLQCNALV